jgi:plastocyanin
MQTRSAFVSAVSVVALLGLAACGSDDKSTDSVPPSAANSTEQSSSAPAAGGVTIADFAFDTGSGVVAGAEFTVTNNDSTTHTFSAVDGTFSVSVGGGEVGRLTIDTPGTYQVVCQIHSSMTGTLTVG